jgi:hypothetical protein
MKKYIVVFVCLIAAAGWSLTNSFTSAQVDSGEHALPSPNLVISQFQAGGTANPNDEFVEIHNIGSAPVDLNGYRVVYRSANCTNEVCPFAVWSASTILQAGQVFFVA